MIYFSKEYLSDAWDAYVLKRLDCISFAAPFFFSRIFTPFKTNEAISSKILEAALFSITAFTVQYNVENNNLEDYSYSYLPVIGSFVYHNIEDSNPIVKFVGASIASLAFKEALDSNSIPYLIPTAITYGISKLNGLSSKYSALLSASSGLADYFISNNNIISFGTTSGIVAQSIYLKYLSCYGPQGLIFAISAGVTGGILLSSYQEEIIEQLFAPSNFKNSYRTLNKFIEPEILNLMLEKYYITMANLQLGIGFYGNHLLMKMQEKINLFYKIEPGEKVRLDNFISVSLKYLSIALMYTSVRTGVDGINSYNRRKLTDFFQDKLIQDVLLKKETFIQLSKTNHTTQTYLSDLETLSIDNNQILEWEIFGLPKLVRIGSLTSEAYAGISAVVAGDFFFNLAFQYLIEKKQNFAEQKTLCLSKFSKITEHDKEYAVTILQKNSLNYTHDKWKNSQQCIHTNSLGKAVFSNMIDSFQDFYQQNLLYTGLHMIVAYTTYTSTITVGELSLHTRTLQILVDTILFKSKNQASFSNIESSINRLNSLFDYLDSTNNSISNIDFTIDNSKDFILIENLEFTRGNREQTSRVFIQKLELFMGKFYAITGANGSGKSSLTTLLQYVIEKISDQSFTVKSGNITYPHYSLGIIPQKDYIPASISLFDLIMHPEKKEGYLDKEQKVINYINELQVFQNDVNSNALYEVKEDWKELSGGQKKKLFLIKELLICPKILIADEIFGPLDPASRHLVMEKIENSCLQNSLLLVVWHQDKNSDNTSCVRESFFDYEAHLQNEGVILGKVGIDCFDD